MSVNKQGIALIDHSGVDRRVTTVAAEFIACPRTHCRGHILHGSRTYYCSVCDWIMPDRPRAGTADRYLRKLLDLDR